MLVLLLRILYTVASRCSYIFPVLVVLQVFDLLLGAASRSFLQVYPEVLALLRRNHYTCKHRCDRWVALTTCDLSRGDILLIRLNLRCLRVQYKLCATVHRRLQHKARTAVHDGLLRPHLRHCSSAASAVRRLPSVVRTETPAFHVRSPAAWNSLSDLNAGPVNFFSRFTSVHGALEALRLCAM